MKVVASKIKFYGIFLEGKINSSPEVIVFYYSKQLGLQVD